MKYGQLKDSLVIGLVWFCLVLGHIESATIVEGDTKAPFSIATTPSCKESATPFPGLLDFNLDPYLIMLSVKQGGIEYHF